MRMRTGQTGARARSWAASGTEVVIVTTSLIYVLTGAWWLLLTWEALAIAYIAIGVALVWRAPANPAGDERRAAREARGWAWIMPVISSVTGANSAIIALAAKSEAGHEIDNYMLAAAASLGVVLAWILFQVGMANIYRYVAAEADAAAIEFPGTTEQPALMDYMYFAFTIGTSFATSDATIRSRKIRRLATVHGVIAFFYNALVVAVAFQVLQFVVSQ